MVTANHLAKQSVVTPVVNILVCGPPGWMQQSAESD